MRPPIGVFHLLEPAACPTGAVHNTGGTACYSTSFVKMTKKFASAMFKCQGDSNTPEATLLLMKTKAMEIEILDKLE